MGSVSGDPRLTAQDQLAVDVARFPQESTFGRGGAYLVATMQRAAFNYFGRLREMVQDHCPDGAHVVVA